ncbi:putative secreted protein [Minicystis rosea]|nr:putative secreted protein [Minicystis rosea]
MGLGLGACASFVVKLSTMAFDRFSTVYAALYMVPLGVITAALASAVLLLVVRVLGALPPGFRRVLTWSLGLLYFKVFTGTLSERVVSVLVMTVATALAGGGLLTLLRPRVPDTTRVRKAISILAAVTGLVMLAGFITFLRSDGRDDRPVIDAAAMSRVTIAELDLPDPSARGPYGVRFLTYGSGTDRRRPEYGKGAALRTRPVDGRPFFEGWQGGFEGWARTRYWGFGPGQLPLNARVHYPDAPGPHPVVVIAHGAHPMEEASEPGYDYLGEHLASHGYVFVSVDQNFLNSGIVGGQVVRENAARGFLLLQHLRALRGFSEAPGNPLSGLLDLDHVALMGHSRGGEAITIAAAFNRLSRSPDDANIPFDFHFGIRALVAICTTDRQYQPAGLALPLEDVSYLALAGSSDADVEHFEGLQQLERIRYTRPDGGFKAAVYVHRANHGQYNRVWARGDGAYFPLTAYVNKKPIMPAADQERIARTYITAFLEATLRDRREYRALFRDHRAGARWLPQTIYIHRYVGAEARMMARFDEDLDVTTLALPGGRIEGESLTVWREVPIGPAALAGRIDARGVMLGWDVDARAGVPRYTMKLPPGFAGVDPEGALVLALADANLPPNPRGLRKPGFTGPTHPSWNKAPRPPIDLDIELADAHGRTARVALGSVGLLQTQLDGRIWKGIFTRAREPEPVLGTFTIPIARFTQAEPELDVAHLAEIRFVFDRSPAGVVILKDVGFDPGR